MKKTILSLFILATVAFITACKNDKANKAETTDAADAQATTDQTLKYNVNTKESTINWMGSKPTGKHRGTISLSSGEVGVVNGAIASGKFTIDMNTIVDEDLTEKEGKADLEAHLKGTVDGKEDHFFDVKKFPQGSFEITNIIVPATAGEIATIEGNLTLKGETKNIKFPATTTVDDSNVSIVSDVFTINRTLWKINYGSKSIFDNLGDKFINDDIELKISIKASK